MKSSALWEGANTLSTTFFTGKPSFYPILNVSSTSLTDTDFNALKQKLAMWQSCGLTYYQLRAKSISNLEYLKLAENLQSTHPQMQILANDFAKAALSHPKLFCGLHIGQEDLRGLSASDKETREALYNLSRSSCKAKSFILGLSTHKAAQIRFALTAEDAIAWDYIALGPCFATSSKTQKTLEAALPRLPSTPSISASSPISQIPLEKFTEALETLLTIKQDKSLKSKQIPETLVLIGGIRASNITDLFQRAKIAEAAKFFRIVPAAIQAAENKQEIAQILA